MEILYPVLQEILGLIPHVAWAASAVVLLVDLAKRAGLPDGYSGLLSLALNAAVWIAIAIAKQLGTEAEVTDALQMGVKAAEVIVPLIISLWGSGKLYDFLKVRKMAKSYSLGPQG